MGVKAKTDNIMYTESNYKEDKRLILFERTVNNHKSICESLGIFIEYEKAVRDKKNVGGTTVDASRKHFLGRYLNSAARTQFVVNCIDDILEDVSEDIISYFMDGTFFIVDIAAGHGAGVISIINMICKLRESGDFATDKLNIVINAIDFSVEALNLYTEVISSMRKDYLSLGIHVDLITHEVDISNDEKLSACIDNIRSNIEGDRRYLLICSAISGVGRDFFEKNFLKSYKNLTKSFAEKNSSFVWIEPAVKGDWVGSIVDGLDESLRESTQDDDSLNKIKMIFYWEDPHTKAELKSQSEVYKIKLSHA